MDTLQFYPTPLALAQRAFSMFNGPIIRLLEPSAGTGDLLEVIPTHGRNIPVDVIEIDTSKHPGLNARGFNVVGLDFLQFKSLSIYSHILMNPPFSAGCQHVLRAWEGIFDGEIVAILNAETIRNPLSQERQHLVRLIETHGSVQYVGKAFQGTDAMRQSDVDVAIVYLRKIAQADKIIGRVFQNLRADDALSFNHGADASNQSEQTLMLPTNFIENAVLIFNAAVAAAQEYAHAKTRANYYAGWLGKTMAQCLDQHENNNGHDTRVTQSARDLFCKEYLELKDRAWTHILHSTKVREKLTVKTRNKLESEFEKLKALEFTVENIYAFLQGLSESGWEMQRDMLCETFDLFSRYYEDNTAFYMGWKSNGKHRTCAMRLKTTRLILPGYSTTSWENKLSWSDERILEDIDRTFAILDGSSKPEYGVAHLFRERFKDLRDGQRLPSTYMDIRYYPQRGTIHFFPRRKDLVDRLNRLVGQWRQWLPPQTQQTNATDEFWRHYKDADKFTSDIINRYNSNSSARYARLGAILYGNREHCHNEQQILGNALSDVFESNGYRINNALDSTTPSHLTIN